MEYIVLYLIALFPVFYYDNSKRVDVKNRYLIFEWLCVVCLMGFRYHVGGDSYNYEEFYKTYPTLSDIHKFNFLESKFGFLWDLFTIICKTISDDFFGQQIIVAVIVNFSIFYFFKKHVRKYFTAIFIFVLLYLFKYNTEILRASISVSIFLFSFDYLINKKWLIYYVFCIISYLFHHEAIVLFFLPGIHLLDKVKINLLSVLIMLGVVYSLIISLSFFPFLQELVSFDAVMSRKIEKYGTIVEGQLNIVGLLYNLIVYYFPVCLLIWLRRDVKDIINPFLIIYIAVRLLSLRWLHITGRMEDFLIIIVIAAFVNQLNKDVLITKKVIARITLLCFIILTFINTTLHLYPLVYPYHSIFDPIDEPGRYELYLQMLNNEL